VLPVAGQTRPGGKRSDTPSAETNDDKSGGERKAGNKKKRKGKKEKKKRRKEDDGGKRGADAVLVRKLKLTSSSHFLQRPWNNKEERLRMR
jgi:hypothetical protein